MGNIGRNTQNENKNEKTEKIKRAAICTSDEPWFSHYAVVPASYRTLAVLMQSLNMMTPGADPGFRVRGAHLEKLCRAEGGAIMLGYFV